MERYYMFPVFNSVALNILRDNREKKDVNSPSQTLVVILEGLFFSRKLPVEFPGARLSLWFL